MEKSFKTAKQKGADMHIDQADLFEGMDRLFLDRFMKLTTRERYLKGDYIFHEGDKAKFFYTLIEGYVKLSIGNDEKEVFIMRHPGEAFGLSSILDRNYYYASAECVEPTHLHKIERSELNQLLHDYPEASIVFYKRVANRLAQRLVDSYKII